MGAFSGFTLRKGGGVSHISAAPGAGSKPPAGRKFKRVQFGAYATKVGVDPVTALAQWEVQYGATATKHCTAERAKGWQELADSDYFATLFKDRPGQLWASIPLIPNSEVFPFNEQTRQFDSWDMKPEWANDRDAAQAAVFERIAGGEFDWVWTSIARNLKLHGGSSPVARIGWECNGQWYPWGVAGAANADLFKRVFTHVAAIFRRECSGVIIVQDVSTHQTLAGFSHGIDMARALFVPKGVADAYGCDIYDSWNHRVPNRVEFQDVMSLDWALCADHVRQLCEERRVEMVIPEFGLVDTEKNAGGGDNPEFLYGLRDWVKAHPVITAINYWSSDDQNDVISALSFYPEASVAFDAIDWTLAT